jgi:hypothetical protein
MTNWYLDSEFNEDGKTIELISIALVCEDGREYYAVSSEFDEERIRRTNPWVAEHVLPILGDVVRKSRRQIADDIAELTLALAPLWQDGRPVLSFWGYFADYDWVLFCQLWGRMVDLPNGMPFFCNDVKQLMRMVGVAKDELVLHVPQTDEHNALADARWIKGAHRYISERVLSGELSRIYL